ncbi:uncharacterized protein LOC100184282 [Ciona intestinalis]
MSCLDITSTAVVPDRIASRYRRRSMTSFECDVRQSTSSYEGKLSISSDGFRTMMRDIENGLSRRSKQNCSSTSDLNGFEFGGFISRDSPFTKAKKTSCVQNIGKVGKKKCFGSISNISVCSSVSHRVKRLDISTSRLKERMLKKNNRKPSDKNEKLQQKLDNLFAWLQRSGKKAGRYALNRRGSPIPMTKLETRKKSLDLTLKEVLSKKETTNAFRKFLSREMSEENLDFWLEVESYKKAKESKRQKLATRIYEKYISPSSTHEINLESYVRDHTERKLKDISPDTFDLAQKHIFALMETDSFRRFLDLF